MQKYPPDIIYDLFWVYFTSAGQRKTGNNMRKTNVHTQSQFLPIYVIRIEGRVSVNRETSP